MFAIFTVFPIKMSFNFHKLCTEVLVNRGKLVEWCQDNNLLKRSKRCPQRNCRRQMKLDFTGSGIGRFRCLSGILWYKVNLV